MKEQEQKHQRKDTTAHYVNRMSGGVLKKKRKKDNLIRKMKMNKTVNIMMMRVVRFVGVLLVNAMVFCLINGGHI
jgi:hypothetical protein